MKNLAIAAAAALLSTAANASPLHGFDWIDGKAVNTDNGVVTPLGTNATGFGFFSSGKPVTGTLYFEVLIPNNDALTAPYTFNGTNAAVTGTTSVGNWTKGTLGGFINAQARKEETGTGTKPKPPANGTPGSGTHEHPPSAGKQEKPELPETKRKITPPNNISAWLPTTQSVDAGATGYDVFQAKINTDTLLKLALSTMDDTLGGKGVTLNRPIGLPAGSIITAFMVSDSKNGGWITIPTSSSGGLFVTGATVAATPIPAMGLIGFAPVGAGMLWAAIRRRKTVAQVA
jgi:hypothetical protein